MRVSELAKELGKTSKEVLDILQKQGHEVKSHSSSLSDEQAQHLYRKLGYKDAGCLLLEGEALEIIFTKTL